MLTWIFCIMVSIFGILGIFFEKCFLVALGILFVQAVLLVVEEIKNMVS